MMPTIVDTMGHHGAANALDGAPPITALIGDQPASLFGQCLVRSGAKVTFGTGAMLDMVHGDVGPSAMTRYPSGCFPIVARSENGKIVWGLEAIVLSAGSCIDWLRDELGFIEEPSDSEKLALSVPSSEGVWFVPALSGLGTPQWDFGARAGFFGLSLGTKRAHMVRAVLEGIAHRGADLVEAAQVETGATIEELRVDGGMSANGFLVQSLSNYTGIPVTVSSEKEATTRGVGLMALVSAGYLTLDDVEALWSPAQSFEPQYDEAQRHHLRAQWSSIVQRVEKTIPDLSAVSF
jgi:glycerol kinase